jgi:hypothetical protein
VLKVSLYETYAKFVSSKHVISDKFKKWVFAGVNEKVIKSEHSWWFFEHVCAEMCSGALLKVMSVVEGRNTTKQSKRCQILPSIGISELFCLLLTKL